MMPRSPQSKASAIAAVLAASVSLVSANSFPVEKPAQRFKPFNQLDTTAQNIAEEKLGYTSSTWNNHGLAEIERSRWTSLTSNQRDAAVILGFGEKSWDCFINHYESYSWEELDAAGAQAHYRGLGWTEEHWTQETGESPSTESRWWDMLTDTEKASANGICYFEDNWDRIDMNPNPSYFPHPFPEFRYKPWSEMGTTTQYIAAGMMNYTEESWDQLGLALVEKNTFLNLEPDQRDGALELGFYTHTWDCFMNHYMSYFWSSFQEDLLVAVETLGWTEEMWSDGSSAYPASEETMWVDLTPDEKAAATRLCYFREVWDDEPITMWYDYDLKKNTAVTSDGPVPKDINLDIFEGTGYAGRAPGQVGVDAYTSADSSASLTASAATTIALALSMAVFLFV
jgi:hypothetical protein